MYYHRAEVMSDDFEYNRMRMLKDDDNSYYPYGLLYDLSGYWMVWAWGISFYPQFIMNFMRGATEGMSVAFQWYNIIGFSLLLYYTTIKWKTGA